MNYAYQVNLDQVHASGWPGYYTESGALFASDESSVEGSSSGSHGLGFTDVHQMQ